MSTDTAYHLAAVPEPVTALGKKLRPFSLGHRLILERENSAFVTGAPVTFPELIFAIAICSHDYAGALRFLNSPLSFLMLKWWGFKVWLAVKFGGHDLGKSAAHFAEYISHGSRTPNVSVKENKNEPMRCPFSALVKVYLQSRLGYSAAEVVNIPWGQAVWEYSIHAALEGHCKLVDAELAREIAEIQLTPQIEIDKWIAAARKAGANV
jgi:hypothetical protein